MSNDMANWLARQTGRPEPQQHVPPQYPQPGYPPQYPPQGYPQQPYYQPQPQYPQQYQQPQPYYPQPLHPMMTPYQQQMQQGPPLKANGQLDVSAARAMYGKDYEGIVAQMWQGGEATRSENQKCPVCGDDPKRGGVLFSMNNTDSIMNVHTGQNAHTAPYCATCGYRPGKRMQGEMSNWVAA